MVAPVSSTATGTMIDAPRASVIVIVHVPSRLPPFTVNVSDGPLGFGGVVMFATKSSLGAGDGAGLAALQTIAEVKAAVSPVSGTINDCGAGLVASNTSDPGEATGVGIGVGLGDGDGLGEIDGDALGDGEGAVTA